MRRLFFTLLALCTTLMVQATVLGKHVSINLRHDNIPVEQAPQHFDQWMKVNIYTTFVLVKDEIDELGYRHQQYEQQYNGVTVDAARLLVHSKDGKITHVNGFVMEDNATRPKRALNRNSVNVPENGELVMVEVSDGFHYAVKVLDHKTMEYVYTDVETGKVIKRLTTIHHATPLGQKTIKSKSYYYGDVDIDVTKLDNGLLLLADSIRKIYTYDAGAADTIPSEYLFEDKTLELPTDSTLAKSYFDNELRLAQTWRDHFTMHQIGTATISLSDAARKTLADQNEMILVININDIIVTIPELSVKDFPYTLIPEDLKSENKCAYSWRMCDTDTTFISLYKDEEHILDYLAITPKPEDGEANVNVKSQNGMMTGDATLKPCGHYGVDAQWGMARVYDFYKEKLGRSSYDNCGSPILNFINPPHEVDNKLLNLNEPNAYASYTIINRMVYGRGNMEDGSEEQVEVGTLGHEFTHLVTGNTADLEYEGESGAINESFSDMFCAAVNDYVANNYLPQYKGDVKHNFAIGSDSERSTKEGCIRAFYDPWLHQNTKALQGKYWVRSFDTSSDNDYGGVHGNSGVLNFWFYILCQGYDPSKCMMDTTVIDRNFATTAKWEGIGIEKAIKIAYRTLTRYLTPKSDILDAYEQFLVAATDLGYDENSTEYKTMVQCFKAVIPTEMRMENSLEGAVSLEFVEAYTTQVFSQTEDELVDLSQEEINKKKLLPGLVNVTAKMTLLDPAKLRSIMSKPTNMAKFTVEMGSEMFENQPPVFDFSKEFRAFLTTCLNEAKEAGYSETHTTTSTLECGGPMELYLNAPTLHLATIDKIEVDQQPRTYLEVCTPFMDNLSLDVKMYAPFNEYQNIYTTSETVNLDFYKVDESGETLLDKHKKEFNPTDNKYMRLSQNQFYADNFEIEEKNVAPGDYVLKVTSTWKDLLDANLKIHVPGPTGITDLKAAPAQDNCYDLQGRRIDGSPEKGMYINNGKIILIK